MSARRHPHDPQLALRAPGRHRPLFLAHAAPSGRQAAAAPRQPAAPAHRPRHRSAARQRVGERSLRHHADLDWGSEALFLRHLDRAGCVFDVGANVGYYAMLCAPLVRAVHAFEPDPRNWPHLERNAARAGNIVVVRSAVHRACGEMDLDVSGDSAVSRLMPDGAAARHVRTPVTTLDGYARNIAGIRVTAIKIDVEGEDLAVLEGARELLARDAPLVLTEFGLGGKASNEAGRLFDLVAALHYGVSAFVPVEGKPVWSRPRFRLAALDKPALAKVRFKMLFLVPPRLRRDFAGGV